MKKTLLVIVTILLCFSATLFIYFSQKQQEKTQVKVVKDFLSFCYDGKMEEARNLTSKISRISETGTYIIDTKLDGKEFDWTQMNAMSDMKFSLIKVLEVQEGKYQTMVLVLAKNKGGLTNKLGFCLTKDIKTNEWKINHNRLYLDNWDFESSYKNDICVAE